MAKKMTKIKQTATAKELKTGHKKTKIAGWTDQRAYSQAEIEKASFAKKKKG